MLFVREINFKYITLTIQLYPSVSIKNGFVLMQTNKNANVMCFSQNIFRFVCKYSVQTGDRLLTKTFEK